MSQKNNPNPPTISQAELDLVIGRKVFGPFKRVLTGQINEAKECITACEILIKEHMNDPEQEPSELDVKTLKSFYVRMRKQLDKLKAIPNTVENQMNLPTVVASSRRETFATGVQQHLEEQEYENTLSNLTATIGKYELWFNTEGIELETVQPYGITPSQEDIESAMGGDGSKKGSDSSVPTPNSTHEKFSFDEPDYLDRSVDIAYIKELEAKAATLAKIENSILRTDGKSKRVPTVPSGPNDSVVSIENTIREQLVPEKTPSLSDQMITPKPSPANSIRSARIKVQEPKPSFPSNQPKPDPSEVMDDILHVIEERQAEKERENKRTQELLLKEVAYWRKENQYLRQQAEKSGNDSEERKEPKRGTPKQENYKRSPEPEIKKESQKIKFTSSSESEEDEDASYDEEDPSNDEHESEYRYATGHDDRHNSKYNLRHKVTQRRTYRQQKVRLDDVRKNLIGFNGTGRFEDFQTIFYDEVMDNDGIKPFMKVVLLREHLKGKASEYMYDLEDPLEVVQRTFQDLKKTFGGKTDKMTLHEKFNSLPFSKTDCDKMITDIAAHRKVMAQLEEKKVDINDIRSITTFAKKLPSKISEKVIKRVAKAKDGEITFEEVLDIVEDRIKVLKTSKSILGDNKIQGSNELMEPKETPIHYTNSQSHQNPNFQQRGGNKPQGSHQPNHSGQKGNSKNGKFQKGEKPSEMVTTQQPLGNLYDIGKPKPKWSMVAWSFPFGAPEQGKACVACDGAHNPIRCPLTSTEFRKKLQERNICERCTLSGHKADKCPKWHTCAYCTGDHAMGGCPLKEFYRKRENIPSSCVIKDENSPRKQFFRKNGNSNSQ